MQKLQTQQKNYTGFSGYYQLVLPLNFEKLIPEDDSVRLLSHITEELNYQKLYLAYSHLGRKPAVDPKILFKILAYAYSQNIYSSRKIEIACKRDVNFMWLLQGYPTPDHSTVSRFRKGVLGEALEDLFYQLTNLLYQLGEIRYENLFIDGTKIEANANRYTFVWKKVVSKNEAKMLAKVLACVEAVNFEYMTLFTVEKETMLRDLKVVLDYLESKAKQENIVYVHGIGKRKTKLQRFAEELESYCERQRNYDIHNKLFGERNNYSKTDPDATFMHMKDDHMRNAQLKPGYNVQIGVESEYVVGMDLFQDRTDVGTLIPFLNSMKRNLGETYINVIADSGYESEENYLYLEKNMHNCYIKPQTYEKWKKRSFKNDISKRENMEYDADLDVYTCHNGEKLRPVGVTHRKSASGYRSEITIYESDDCSNCKHKPKCSKAAGNRRLQASKTFIAKRDNSLKNISSAHGILLRMNRSIQVEGAFGVLKNDYQFNRFLTRGKNSVKTEFMLLCFAYNINKLHSKIQNGRSGKHLHEIRTA